MSEAHPHVQVEASGGAVVVRCSIDMGHRAVFRPDQIPSDQIPPVMDLVSVSEYVWPPGWFWRLLGDTFEKRIIRAQAVAIREAERQRAVILESRRAAEAATRVMG